MIAVPVGGIILSVRLKAMRMGRSGGSASGFGSRVALCRYMNTNAATAGMSSRNWLVRWTKRKCRTAPPAKVVRRCESRASLPPARVRKKPAPRRGVGAVDAAIPKVPVRFNMRGMEASLDGPPPISFLRAPIAGILAWVVPGLGHLFLGERKRGIILLVTISLTFWTGVAVGGVGATVNPRERKLWFMAQFMAGGQSLAACAMSRSVMTETKAPNSVVLSHWLSADVGIHYTGVAGLLNLLAILDAIARAELPRASRRLPFEEAQAGP